MLAIHPYKYEGLWVFDDEKVNLVQEPFVSGADTIIETIVQDIPNANEGFTLIFSAEPFPGHQVKFDWVREESGGNWYYIEALDSEGWLCPALFKYFEKAPKNIYAQFKAKSS